MVCCGHREQVDSGCFAVLSSCFRTKRKNQSPVANGPSDKTSPQNSSVETPRPEASLPATNAPGTTLPDPSDALDTPTPPIEKEESTQTQENDLWRKAFEKIDEVAKKRISEDFRESGDEGPARSLIRIVEEHGARFQEKSAKIKVGERVIIWRDYAARVVYGLTALGDIAIQFAPAPSSIIWSALKVLLKTHVNECESLAAMLGCATQVLPLVRCGAIYEKVYLEDISDELHEPAANLREALVNLYAKILQLLARAKHDLSNSRAMRFLHALLHSGEGEELIQDLNKAEKQLGSAVRACQAVQAKTNNEESQKLLQSLDKPLRHIDDGVKTILDKVSADDRSKMLDMLSSVAFGDQHIRRTKSRTEGTGKWLLKHREFHDWETSSSSSILWLKGKMGAGKSILASNVVDRYWVDDTSECEPVDEGFAFFYYSKNDQELKGDPIAHILGSFLRQLATVPHYPKEIYTGLNKLRRRMEEKKITFDAKLFKEILSQLVDLLPRTFIILDGLDEFENLSDIAGIVRFFVELVEKSERPVKIFISSREEPYIRDELLKAKHNLGQITILDKNQPDIKEFVQQRTQEIGSYRYWATEVKQKVETTLCDNADGMFRWVYLQIEQLADISSEEAVRERLKGLPQSLGEAYDELYNAKIGWDQTFLKRAIKWVMYAREPLSTSRLLSAVQLGHNCDNGEHRLAIASRLEESALENICRHLIVKDSQDNWKFSHASVAEYFRSGKHKSWIFGNAQVDLAKLSLLLLTAAFRDWTLPESDKEATALVNGTTSDGRAQNLVISLRSYVAKHWLSHIREIQGDADECTGISQLLKRFMISQDEPYRSSLGYRTWARYIYLRSWLEFGFNLVPTDNPAFGIVALGLNTVAKQWGEDCLSLNLVHLNKNGLDLPSLAVRYGNSELCGRLIELGSDVNRILPSGSSALLEAIGNGQTACVSKLLELGADPNLRTSTHSLCQAAQLPHNSEPIIKLLLRYDANPDTICTSRCLFDCALVAVASCCSLEVAKLLIDHGADVNIHPETGLYGGVLAAAFLGFEGLTMVAHLIEKAGADPHRIISDLSVRDPWMDGSGQASREDIARYLLSHNHVTLDELRSLERKYQRRGIFSRGFLSSLVQAQAIHTA